jgi:TolB-like protein/tetratricopeptide (TPR) repeat protein
VPGPDVFLSYNRGNADFAQKLFDALSGEGLEVWWDLLLGGGDAFAQTTEQALETAGAVVVLWSVEAIQSHWVRDEATRGRDRGRLVPVSIDGTKPPLGFRQIQYLDLSGWKGNRDDPQLDRLVKAIRAAAAGRHDQVAFQPPPLSAPVATSRRGALMIGGGALALLAGGFGVWQAGLLGGLAQTNSVAVLPFRNLSDDPQQSYFSDGLSEELRATLSRITNLAVAAETSSNSFRDSGPGVRQIAKTLGVAFLLQGSVRRAGDMVRITAQLVDGASGFETWSKTFDRKLADIIALQSEIAMLVADALAINIAGAGQTTGKRAGGTSNSVAFDAFLRSKALYLSASSEKDCRSALRELDKAIAIDPKFAAAQAYRSRVLTYLASVFTSGQAMKNTFAASVEAARTAVRLAPDMAEGYSALGYVLSNGQLDMKAAQGPYQRSYELGFGNADMLTAFADFAANVRRFDEGRQASARARELDPLNANVFRSAGYLEFSARAFDAAVPLLRAALSLNAKTNVVRATLGDIALLRGQAAEAKAWYEKESSTLSRLRGLATVAMRLGDTAGAERNLADLVARFGTNSFYQQAQIFAQWQRLGEALQAIEKAYEMGDSGLVLMQCDPLLDPVRQDPRFVSVLDRLGFT